MSSLALYLGEQNKNDVGEQMARQALQVRKKILGQTHPDTIITTKILIWILDQQGKHEEAERMELQLQESE